MIGMMFTRPRIEVSAKRSSFSLLLCTSVFYDTETNTEDEYVGAWWCFAPSLPIHQNIESNPSIEKIHAKKWENSVVALMLF
jgi:hypothetical protein